MQTHRATIASSMYSESVATFKSDNLLDDKASDASVASSISLVDEDRRVYISTCFEDSIKFDRSMELVEKLVAKLKEMNFTVYFETDYSLNQSKLFTTSKELKETAYFIPCLTSEYMLRVFASSMDTAFLDLSVYEFTEAMEHLSLNRMIPLVLDEHLLDEHSWRGPVGLLLHKSRPIELMVDCDVELAADEILQVVRNSVHHNQTTMQSSPK
jgi:hypothetical protein